MSLPPMSFPQSADELLRHAAWVRRVARALVRGADRIDDLEQETWLAALSRPPRHTGDKRSWLGAVTRNVAKHLFRSEATRERHEFDPAHARAGTGGVSGASPAAGEIVARAEIQQRVAAAVLALEEPYKSTLLARYFDELPPTEIARALDVSVETVKTRLKRGLAQLRERLESLKGDAPTLEAALAPLCAPLVPAAVPAVAKLAAVAATLMIGVTIVASMNRHAQVHRVDAANVAASAEPASPASSPAAAAAQDSTTSESSSLPSTTAARVKESSTVPHAAADDAPAHLSGRLLLPDGSAAASVALRLFGWGANQERELRYGVPSNWRPIDTASSPDGTFSIEFTAPRAFQFTFEAKLDGYAAPAWRWGEIAPGSTKALGDITLRRAGSIRGRVVDGSGRPVPPAGWYVQGYGPKCVEGDGADETVVTAIVDESTGGFILENVPPGKVGLSAHSEMTSCVDGPEVEVRSGENTDALVVYAGLDVAHRITVNLFSRPFYIFEQDAEEIILTGNGIEPRLATKIHGSSQSHSFDDVPDGVYTVEIHDPKFLPWRREGVVPGTSVSADLKGNAQIGLHVVDTATGAEIPRYSLRVRFSAGRMPDTFELLSPDEIPNSSGRFDGMLPVNQTLLVRAHGFAPCSLPLMPLAANQLTEVTARLTKGAMITGTVLRADGVTPVANARIHLEARRSESAEPTGLHVETGDEPAESIDAESGADGHFEFTGVAPGRYSLRSDDAPPLEADLDGIEVREDTSRIADLDLILPPRGFLVGRLIIPDGATCAGLDVVAVQLGESAEERFRRHAEWDTTSFRRQYGIGGETAESSLRADGTFRIGPMPVGPTEVRLAFPSVSSPVGKNSFTGSGDSVELPLNVPVPASSSEKGTRNIAPGPVTVVDGEETRVDFDARAIFPGVLRVEVTVNGAPAADAVVELAPDPSTESSKTVFEGVELLAAGQIGDDGSVTLRRVPVGSARVIVRGIDRSWSWSAAHDVEIAAGAESRATFAITLVAGDVLVEDRATDTPVPSYSFEIRVAGGARKDAFHVESDAGGRVHLRLPPGSYVMKSSMLLNGDEDAVRFDWTDHGAAKDTLRIPIPIEPEPEADDENDDGK